LAFASSARLVASSLALASALWAGVKTTGGRFVDGFVDPSIFVFFIGCILKFLLQSLIADYRDIFKRDNLKLSKPLLLSTAMI
jgi:hypothetical protein